VYSVLLNSIIFSIKLEQCEPTTQMDIVIGMFSRLPSTSELFATTDQWWTTVVPLLGVVIGVNLFFRHAISVLWFTVKLLISVMIYTHIKEVLHTSIGSDPMESMLLGITNGTLQMSQMMGREIMKSQLAAFTTAIYPNLFPDVGEQEEVHEETSIDEEDISWINWVRNII
jgi:hypothetical protein